MTDAESRVPELEPGGTTLLDLTSTPRKTRGMKDQELVILAGGYGGTPTTLGQPLFVEVAKAECAGHDQPGFWEVGRYHDEKDTYTARPVLEKNNATLPCRWDENGFPIIDMLPIIIATDTLIPEETNVRIPVSRKRLSNGQEVVLLHFGKLTYQPVEKGKGKKKAAPPTSSSTPNSDTEDQA